MYRLESRGRLNALLFSVVFIGMALGSVPGCQVYTLANWQDVVTLATLSGAIALVIRLTAKQSSAQQRVNV